MWVPSSPVASGTGGLSCLTTTTDIIKIIRIIVMIILIIIKNIPYYSSGKLWVRSHILKLSLIYLMLAYNYS